LGFRRGSPTRTLVRERFNLRRDPPIRGNRRQLGAWREELGFRPLGEEAGAGSGAEEEERTHDERAGRCLVNAFSFWANQHYWTVGWMGLDSIDT
jgi:hypothetical protein